MTPLKSEGDYFRCSVLNCTLSKEACGRRFSRASEIEIRDDDGVNKDQIAYMPCRGCFTGEANSSLVKTPQKKLRTIRLGRAVVGEKV